MRPWHQRWGATQNEVEAFWPGDELIARPLVSSTHAVTIQAPVSKVWPWLVQIGQGRGGFYSYEFVENAMGLKMENADRILPEWQNLQVGDVVPLAPDGSVDLPVVILEREKVPRLARRHTHPWQRRTARASRAIPRGDMGLLPGRTRAPNRLALIERFRLEYTPILANEFIVQALPRCRCLCHGA